MNDRAGMVAVTMAALAMCGMAACARHESVARPRLLDANVARVSRVDALVDRDLMRAPDDASISTQSVACWNRARNSGRPRLMIDEPACDIVTVPADLRFD